MPRKRRYRMTAKRSLALLRKPRYGGCHCKRQRGGALAYLDKYGAYVHNF